MSANLVVVLLSVDGSKAEVLYSSVYESDVERFLLERYPTVSAIKLRQAIHLSRIHARVDDGWIAVIWMDEDEPIQRRMADTGASGPAQGRLI